jgi:cysteine desulfurase
MDGMDAIYLDHNATTRPAPEVVRAVTQALEGTWANPSSPHAPGRVARRALATARGGVAALLSAEPGEVVFTSGGTEADALAIEAALAWGRQRGRDVVVSTAVEHPAVRERLLRLERAGACRVRWAPVDPDGRLDAQALLPLLAPDVALVTCMWANHETGILLPVRQVADLAHECGALAHSDAVQAAGRVPLAPGAVGLDLCSLSAHKLHGPPGVGALWVRGDLAIPSTPGGGHQERGLRAGTGDVPGACGFAAAAGLARTDLERDLSRAVAARRDRLEANLMGRVAGCARNGAADPRLPNTTSLRFAGTDGAELVRVLSELGVHASTGSACTSASLEPSHVLTSMGLTAEEARGTLRLSLGRDTTDAEIEAAARTIERAVARVRKLNTGLARTT